MLKTVFSFDFDNTISRDPEGMLWVMDLLRRRGHDVIVCTARLNDLHTEDFDFIRERGYKVYWSNHQSKNDYLRSVGIKVDVWVDDCPDAVLNDYHGEPRTYRDMLIRD